MNQDASLAEVDDFTFLPGTVSLVEEVDHRILVVLQDGRKLLGVLRSFDQYANLVLEQTLERIYVGEHYAEKNLGLFLVRGDNIVLLGPIDESREELCVKGLTKVTLPEIEAARKAEREAKRAQWELKQKMNQDPWS